MSHVQVDNKVWPSAPSGLPHYTQV